jgi:CBS domain-containing protein
MKIQAIMSQQVASCGPDTNLGSVVEAMGRHGCGIVPVVNERGETIGVVTDRDICLSLGRRDLPPSALVARNVMTQPVIGCAPDDDSVVALLTMVQHHVRRLPVLGPAGVLVGVLSIDDIVRCAARAPATDPLRVAVLDVLASIVDRPRPAGPGSGYIPARAQAGDDRPRPATVRAARSGADA